MTSISASTGPLVLVNTFTVDPNNQQPLVQLLTEAIISTISVQPGFISSHLYTSLDGTRVINIAQWESKEACEAVFQNPASITHMRAASDRANTTDPGFYDVALIMGPTKP